MVRRFGRRGILTAATAFALPALALSPKSKPKPKEAAVTPTATIKLKAIGASMPAAALLAGGVSGLTVNFIDNTHLLVTWATHQLVPRVEGDPATDQDRILAAEIVEIPSGQVLSKTTWQAHDLARYLFPIGHGRFAVRLGKQLGLMDPRQDPNGAQALQRTALAHVPGAPFAVTREPQGEVFAAITENPLGKQDGAKITFGDLSTNEAKPTYTVQYFRMEPNGNWAEKGRLRADMPLVMPMDADGYLWSTENVKRQGQWDLVFHSFDGKITPVGPVDSSCAPRTYLVSRSEFLALTCFGDSDGQKLRSLGFDGHETWEEDFGGFAQQPVFVTSAEASRFAMSRTWSVVSPGDTSNTPNTSLNEEVRVYQAASGDLLAKVSLAPVFRTSENFDLSEDGRVLATVNKDEIDIYSLPELSKTDREDIAEVSKFAPAPSPSSSPVYFPELFEVGSEKAAETASVGTKQALSAPLTTTTAAVATPVGGVENWGDTQAASGARTRPTLLNPGEKPEFKDKAAPVQ